MKTNPRTLLLVVAVAALFGNQAVGQATNPRSGLGINPLTGLPQNIGSALAADERLHQQTNRDLLSSPTPPAGDSQPNQDGDLTLLLQAQALNANEQYDEALQCFLKLYAQSQASTNGVLLETALPDWAELGKKYPKAKQALVDIRDPGARQCSQGNGDLQLFQEVVDINGALGDDAATVEWFKGIRQNHPAQAEEWYLFVEPVLVRCGEYQLCLDCIGNPETRFNTYCYTFKRLQALYEDMRERSVETRRKLEALSQQPGRPPMSPYPHVNPGKKGLRITRDNYADEVRRLIEILVGTGHKEEAEKIRGQAMVVLDDPRLQSAVRDAEEIVQKRSTPAVTSGGK